MLGILNLPSWALWLELAWVIAFSGIILLERRPPLATLAWIVGLAWLPIGGAIVYYFLGPRRLGRRKMRRVLARRTVRVADARAAREPHADADRDAVAREFLPTPRELAQRFGDVGASLATTALTLQQPPPLRCEALTILATGAQAFDSILSAIAKARHHVHLEYYILRDDAVGQRVIAALTERARQGVEIRLLVDGVGSRGIQRLVRPLIHAGGAVARFGPRMRPGFINFRTHRKIVVCDGTVGFTGGMNLEEGHDERVVGERAWRDTHLRLEGDAVGGLQLAFLEDWHYATGDAPTGMAYLHPLTHRGEHAVQICASGPDNAPPSIHALFFNAITAASTRLWLTTPYFVPDESMQTALISAALRGVDVRVLLPGKSDHAIVDAAARSYFPELLGAGVRIHRYGPPALHAKTLVVDNAAAIIGTANLDNRSLRLNFEVCAVCYGADHAEALATLFKADLERANRVTADQPIRASIGARLLEGAARLFSPML
jgi:cardiolipin synthase A/B